MIALNIISGKFPHIKWSFSSGLMHSFMAAKLSDFKSNCIERASGLHLLSRVVETGEVWRGSAAFTKSNPFANPADLGGGWFFQGSCPPWGDPLLILGCFDHWGVLVIKPQNSST